MTHTVQEIIDLILREVPGAPAPDTVDTLKTGNPDWPVTGIVTTFMSTYPVLREAAALGANLIITHEPTFYNHRDKVEWLQDDAVYQAKRQYIDEQRLAIWRFHDHWHGHRPDGIMTGLFRQLGWERYVEPGNAYALNLPEQALTDLASFLRVKLNATRIRVLGPDDLLCRRVALLPGSPPGEWYIQGLRDADVLIGGEAMEWQVYEYIRDALALGQRKALIMVGHERSEEPGMAYLAEWLKAKLPEMPITHVASGDPMAQ